MRVAVVVSNLKMGGMERVAINLADAYHDNGHDTHLIYFKDRKRALSPKNSDLPVHLFNLKKMVFGTGIGVIYFILCKLVNACFSHTFPIWFAYAQCYFFKKALAKLEKNSGKFDIIIFRGQGTFEQIWPIQDERFVFVCENVQKSNNYKSLSSLVFRKLFNKRKVACVSDGALKSFIDLTKKHHITPNCYHKISNPNNIEFIREQAKMEQKSLHDKPYILGLGRLVPQKNFSLLVDAYSLLKQRHKIDHDLIIVGSGRDAENIRDRVIHHGLQDYVHFKGQQSNPFPWFHQADLFVLSSKHEGLGMVLVESLACGTKVVATDCAGGVRDVMNGVLEPFLSQETATDLADKMWNALNSDWDEIYHQGVEQILSQFDGRKVTEEFINKYIATSGDSDAA